MWNFFFPKWNRRFLIRLTLVTLAALVLFGFVLMPSVIQGASMEPTYPRVGFLFCNKLKYLFQDFKRGDVVILRYIGRKFYLKRIVGLPGDVVAFRDGDLYVNNEKQPEPYVVKKSNWNMEPQLVTEGHLYVVGDNRSMPIERHEFGQISARRVAGAPLW